MGERTVKKVGYLGPEATFTHIAVESVFKQITSHPYRTIPSCIDGVTDREVDYAVVPLENALEGSVNLTLDYLIHEKRLPIVGEIVLPIRQHFMVHPKYIDEWQNVEGVYSHPHAIAQCHKFLHNTFRNTPLHEVTSTAYAAKHVYEKEDEKIGAIANEFAAKKYGLQIVKKDVHDYDHNTTRFLILNQENAPLEQTLLEHNGYKTTLMITLSENPAGALHRVLSAFSWRNLNLSKIESRPMKTGLGNYFFIIDIEQKLDDVLIPGAIAEIEALGCGVTLLGSYPYYIIK
ncbi:prephenate dehydratase [Priestia endophytica]|uniref:prephenate dehydratase n=1 Tax=Priestia endophytica TaxID=135735 RepID=UPI002E1F3BBF|nr:prephenate dehydratase [Priestia endophytica]MED4070705.1 prephenate dehydratase [Priestia endophytica]